MNNIPVFLDVDHVILIHDRMIHEFGGASNIRDYGLLESAVMMPAVQYEGEFLHKDLASMAAAYLFHICKNHAFVDGNKRTSLAVAEVFLKLNGYILDLDDDTVESLVLETAKGTLSKEELIDLFQKHVKKNR